MQNWYFKLRLYMVIGPLVFIILLFIAIKSFAYLKKIRIKRQATTNEFIWKQNSIYNSDESLDYLNENSGIPGWLKSRNEMLFSDNNIKKGLQLGKGAFGTVFKGQLNQGNAV